MSSFNMSSFFWVMVGALVGCSSDSGSTNIPEPPPGFICRDYPQKIFKKLISNHNGEIENPTLEKFYANWDSSLNSYSIKTVDESVVYIDTYDSRRSFILNHEDFFPNNYLKSYYMDYIGGVGSEAVNNISNGLVSSTNYRTIDIIQEEHLYHWTEHDNKDRPRDGFYSYVDDGVMGCEKLSVETFYNEEDRILETVYKVAEDTVFYKSPYSDYDYSKSYSCQSRIVKKYYDDFGSVYLIEYTLGEGDSEEYRMYEYEYKYEKFASVCVNN
ncbi:hypothetical protein ACJJH9_19190 [Microbulbifer sp. DLAB2-AF]|uniref:hypothetical protein n=1 Tax=Microbulbifer sp. DLAB2-AF TaxID=3243395 RepID=UPI004039BEB4